MNLISQGVCFVIDLCQFVFPELYILWWGITWFWFLMITARQWKLIKISWLSVVGIKK